MKKIIFGLTIFLFFLVPACALAISGGVSYQDLDFSGRVKSDGIEIDLTDDLGIGSEGFIGYNLRLDAGKNHLGLDYASLEAEGANTLSRDIQFNGQTYSASTYVESKLKCDLLEIQYYYDIIDLQWENWGIDLASLFKLNIYEAQVNIKGGGFDESYSETLPLPTVGIAGQLNATRYFSVLAQVNGIGYSDDTYLEYRAILRIKPLKYLNFDFGYRGTQVDYSDSNNLLDLDIGGFLFQGALTFKF